MAPRARECIVHHTHVHTVQGLAAGQFGIIYGGLLGLVCTILSLALIVAIPEEEEQ